MQKGLFHKNKPFNKHKRPLNSTKKKMSGIRLKGRTRYRSK